MRTYHDSSKAQKLEYVEMKLGGNAMQDQITRALLPFSRILSQTEGTREEGMSTHLHFTATPKVIL